MLDFHRIDKEDVTDLVKAGRNVLCAVFYSDLFDTAIYEVSKLNVSAIDLLMKEPNVIFVVEKESDTNGDQ